VRYAGFKGPYGRTVEIDHGRGLVTRYAHASRLSVKKGQVVLPGQVIAAVGSSGRSSGPHLHFEVLQHGRTVSPNRYLNTRPDRR
jgi:murein DD-endopeptidase MepM/ murein hydrolase activator NlpD